MRDLTGQRFGALFVLGKADPHISPSGKKHSMWECRCECGKVGSFYTDHLVAGRTRSCGCLQGHPGGEKHPNYKHGLYRTRLYRIWQGMKHRCYCKTAEDWELYGGRGIGVCDEWRNDFSKFHEWAIQNGYDEKAPIMQCTIDRIDVDKDYSPENCRWADPHTQRINQRPRKKRARNEE